MNKLITIFNRKINFVYLNNNEDYRILFGIDYLKWRHEDINRWRFNLILFRKEFVIDMKEIVNE